MHGFEPLGRLGGVGQAKHAVTRGMKENRRVQRRRNHILQQ
jgi:hypothetical protein